MIKTHTHFDFRLYIAIL